ncbi:hypothetical protein [Roseateles asaccharophilus]|uniref:TonB family protein n=1 Tax=Roseateles asaccharophilus TaxID=582607 RepID=A0ABU2A1E6_9BURK|nr:hypothetical protein [Roseateles asaccharophilus]MDR7330999.1 hypothetical protein [Roseateles asaccharophilus]
MPKATAALAFCLALALPAAHAQHAACPQAGEQLSEYLASAKQRIRTDGEVRVEFEVGADGRAQAVAVQGSRAYLNPVRIAMDTLECQRGTPQRYVLNIRFADPVPRAMASAASATLAQVQVPDKATPR